MNPTFDINFLSIALIAVFVVLTTVFIILIYWYSKESKQRKNDQKASLSLMREHYENQLAEINEKLISTEDRWKEVYHLLLTYQPKLDEEYIDMKVPMVTDFFKNMGIIESDIKIERDLIFVLTPFHQSEDGTFQHIKRIINDFNLRCERGDEKLIQGDIFKNILEHILKARLIIANLNERNPNVFYELGIAQAIGKPTILVSKTLIDIPFDIKTQHILLYKTRYELQSKLTTTIGRLFVKDVMQLENKDNQKPDSKDNAASK